MLLIGGLLLAAFLALGLKFLLRQEGAALVVRVNGSEVARYALTETGDYPLNGGTNVLHIENGSAWLTDADCPDKLCMKQGKIQYTGQTITCLPNRLTVTVMLLHSWPSSTMWWYMRTGRASPLGMGIFQMPQWKSRAVPAAAQRRPESRRQSRAFRQRRNLMVFSFRGAPEGGR